MAAIEWRRSQGLSTDPDFVISVMADPNAIEDWAHPILPAEENFLWQRQASLRPYVDIVRTYGASHPGFGGLYLDNEHSLVMSLWTSDPEGHLAAMRTLAGEDAPIGARLVQWTERQLRELQDRVDPRWPGFAEAEARLMGVGASTTGNMLEVEISSANPDAPRLVAEGLAGELGVPVEMISVESDGTGVELLGTGWVRGVVVTSDGSRPRGSWSIDGKPVTIGYCGGGDIGYGIGRHGEFRIPCKVGDYQMQVWTYRNGRVVLGESPVVSVREGRTSRVTIRLER